MNRDAVQLRDEIRLREASLNDALRERDAGELNAEQFATIRQREGVRLEAARNELGALMASADSTRIRRRVRRTRWLVVALVCFVTVLISVLVAATSPRQAGNSGDGGIDLTRSQTIDRLLSQAEVDVANNQDVTALNAYAQVLTLDPKNVTALTQSGWLDFTAGSAAKEASVVEVGVRELEKAIAVAPRQSAPRLYFAIVADSTPGNQHVARTEFEAFLRLNPSVDQLAIARPFLTKLGIKVPS
jgi:cytochrome c-type biogenesis protein CcmH/NrfG